ncbi:MAG TPA: hypothetical protein VMB79_12330 [Jatrophihabitans sp.]|nr:hypothetical protein [Jatrophihabitans sp.]
MVLTTAPWRAGSTGRNAAARAARQARRESRDARRAQRPERSKGAAASTEDWFLDAVVLISVVLFVLLAAGIGLLALGISVTLP